MPKFTIRLRVTNTTGVPITAYVGASLVGTTDDMEYYNTSNDVKRVFNLGKNEFTRYLDTDLGKNQRYNLVIALWEGEKPIGHGIKYATITVKNAVEKKKKIEENKKQKKLNFNQKTYKSKN